MTVIISVVIPTYNRWETLVAAVRSVREQQGLPQDVHVEIIAVNDGSDQPEYYGRPPDGVTMIHLAENTRSLLGFVCAGFVRNCGVRVSRGDYVAFLDDDDAWEPTKLAVQLAAMRDKGALASCTDAWHGRGTWPHGKGKRRYNADVYKAHHGTLGEWVGPRRMARSNPLITSAVMVHKSVLKKTGLFIENRKMQGKDGVYEDYELWKAVAAATKKGWLWIDESLVYYDAAHGGGRKYEVK